MGEAKENEVGQSNPTAGGSSKAAAQSRQSKPSAQSDSAELTNRKKAVRRLGIAASIYAIWFLWLLYVAWVNVSGGSK